MHLALAVAKSIPPLTIAGLPLHPLIVHAVVVFLPLAAFGGVLMVAWPKFSRRFGPVVVVLAWAGVAGAVAASHTGEQFQVALAKLMPTLHVGSHATFGREVKYAALAFAVFVSVTYYRDWQSGRGGKQAKRTAIDWVIAFFTVATALFAVYLTVQAGHTGAKLVWDYIGKSLAGQ